jgi:hypothetical protein
MRVIPITPQPEAAPAVAVLDGTCFGVTCVLRRSCLRYLAVDTCPGESTDQLTCFEGGKYPRYLNATHEPAQAASTNFDRQPVHIKEE